MNAEPTKFYGYYTSPLCVINITASQNGLTSLTFAKEISSEEYLNDIIKDCKKQLEEYFSGNRTYFNIPIDLGCTDFQTRILEYVKTIPYGSTTSYSTIAQLLLMPKASRAIGMANSKNKILIIIPCHRIIGQSGKLVGYAGGLHRKHWLLEHEAKVCGVTKDQLMLQF